MPPVATNANVGNHSFYPQLSTCQHAGCHANATSFDVGGGQSAMKGGIQELRVALNNAGWLTRSEAAPYEALTRGGARRSAVRRRPRPARTQPA